MLQGILVLLVSMAGLADHACRLPAPAYLPALRLLALAEAIAHCTLLDVVRSQPGLRAPLLLARHDSCDDLTRRLLALAALLQALLEQAGPVSRDFTGVGFDGQANAAILPLDLPMTLSLAWLALQRGQDPVG